MLVAALCSTFAPLPSSTFTFAALIALATLVTVASLFPSPVFASVSPVVALVVKPPVTAFTLPVAVSTVMVALSVVTDTPSVPTVRPPLSFALTETLLSAETEIPSPAVTGVLPPAAPPPCGCAAVIVIMRLPLPPSVLVTVIPPSPLNSTSLPLCTVEVVLSAVTFQPNSFNAVDKSPALTSFFLFASSGAVTVPSETVSSTVSATSLPSSPSPSLTFNPSPAFTLNLAERPS